MHSFVRWLLSFHVEAWFNKPTYTFCFIQTAQNHFLQAQILN